MTLGPGCNTERFKPNRRLCQIDGIGTVWATEPFADPGTEIPEMGRVQRLC